MIHDFATKDKEHLYAANTPDAFWQVRLWKLWLILIHAHAGQHARQYSRRKKPLACGQIK
jgi:hypothetical protein